jgi:hypothetical protein
MEEELKKGFETQLKDTETFYGKKLEEQKNAADTEIRSIRSSMMSETEISEKMEKQKSELDAKLAKEIEAKESAFASKIEGMRKDSDAQHQQQMKNQSDRFA